MTQSDTKNFPTVFPLNKYKISPQTFQKDPKNKNKALISFLMPIWGLFYIYLGENSGKIFVLFWNFL
jgi:hypothetical protein